jgi:hypothetical protein
MIIGVYLRASAVKYQPPIKPMHADDFSSLYRLSCGVWKALTAITPSGKRMPTS